MGLTPHRLASGGRSEGDLISGFRHSFNRAGYREGASNV